MIRPLLITLLLAAGAAQAQPMPPGPPDGPRGPHAPPPHGAPSPEALATVPGLDANQQSEVRRILLQRRDAHDALHAKEQGERDAIMTRYRGENERIDDDSSTRLRKLLGEDGYRNLAQWLAPPRGRDDGPGRPHGRHDENAAPAQGRADAATPGPDADAPAPVR